MTRSSRAREREAWPSIEARCWIWRSTPERGRAPSGGAGERGGDLRERRLLGVADLDAAEAEEAALLACLGDLLADLTQALDRTG